jgi:hypothetical protein
MLKLLATSLLVLELCVALPPIPTPGTIQIENLDFSSIDADSLPPGLLGPEFESFVCIGMCAVDQEFDPETGSISITIGDKPSSRLLNKLNMGDGSVVDSLMLIKDNCQLDEMKAMRGCLTDCANNEKKRDGFLKDLTGLIKHVCDDSTKELDEKVLPCIERMGEEVVVVCNGRCGGSLSGMAKELGLVNDDGELDPGRLMHSFRRNPQGMIKKVMSKVGRMCDIYDCDTRCSAEELGKRCYDDTVTSFIDDLTARQKNLGAKMFKAMPFVNVMLPQSCRKLFFEKQPEQKKQETVAVAVEQPKNDEPKAKNVANLAEEVMTRQLEVFSKAEETMEMEQKKLKLETQLLELQIKKEQETKP